MPAPWLYANAPAFALPPHEAVHGVSVFETMIWAASSGSGCRVA